MSEPDQEQLVVDVLTGDATDEQREKIAANLSSSDEFLEHFLDQIDVEVFLSSEAKAGAFAEDREALFSQLEDSREPSKVVPITRRFWFRVLATTSAAAACLMLILGVFAPRPLSAANALQQLIEASRKAGDRTYSVSVLQGNAELPQRGGQTLTLEDAIVHLRGTDRYVAIQDLTDGSGQRITGFDGEQSWTLVGDEPVYVSDDPTRFRRFLPGGKFDLPFINLHDQLEELRDGYEIELSDDEKTGHRILHAFRKTRGGTRSPRELLISFEPESGVVVSLEFRRPTKLRGRPLIRLDLVGQRDLPADFFSHSAHHEAERPVTDGQPRRRAR